MTGTSINQHAGNHRIRNLFAFCCKCRGTRLGYTNHHLNDWATLSEGKGYVWHGSIKSRVKKLIGSIA